jgi:hypothetical protein
MRRNRFLLFFIVIVITSLSAYSHAQLWSGVLSPTRAIDWSQAGAGTIPNRTTICTTLSAGATAAQINSAISSCASGGVVMLNAGTYNLSGQLNTKANVTLRGAGPDKTLIVFSSCGDGNGLGTCIFTGVDGGEYSGSPGNAANWTAGYAKGTTSITLSSVSNLHVGSLLILDGTDGTQSDPGDAVWVCTSTSCSEQGLDGISGRSGRAQQQQVIVTSINGTTVGITPGIYSPNWASGRSPGAWWSSSLPISGAGIESISVNTNAVTSQYGSIFMFHNAANCWIKNVRSINEGSRSDNQHKHVWIYQSSHITVRDSYFVGSNDGSESYGVDSGASSSDNLVENNIFQHIATATINESSTGSVFGYNFTVDNNYNNGDASWQQCDSYHHSAGDSYILWEGHIGACWQMDSIHGSSWMNTVFRSRYSGRDNSKTEQTNAVHVYSTNRYHNAVGNVLGTSGYHTHYETVATTTTSDGGSTGDLSIFSLGFSGNQSGHTFPDDPRVATSLMRWGNWDTVNNAIRWVAGENAGGSAIYPGLASPTQTMPASFYLNSEPAWWGAVPWPPIGPDVVGGNIANVGGHAYRTPAANCYLTTMGGDPAGGTTVYTFNANNCYSSTALPAAPTDLTVVVQ